MNERNDHMTNSQPPLFCTDCKLGRFTIYGPSRDAEPSQIYTRRRGVLSFQAGKTILREGEPVRQIYTLYSGWAFCFKQMQDGRRQILSFLIPGDTIILESVCFPGLPAPFSVKSLTSVSMCVFELQDMILLTREPGRQFAELSRVMREQVASVSRQLVDLGQKSAVGRIAHFILQLEQRLRSRQMSVDGKFDFPIRQEHIGDALGLTTVYVNRTLHRLRKLEIIEFDRNHMMVRDFEALSEIADSG
jgi:CRP/FNR family transcriptional regulator, anaerobic regulatory protein